MKKVLTAVTALAVLAPTTLVFATSTPITGSDKGNYESNLKIEGIVLSKDNTAPEGQISVTLPTAATFTVNADGSLIAPNTGLEIVNKSACDIDVKVSDFVDNKPNAGITVVETIDDTHKRSDVSLTLSAINGSSVQLKSNGFQSQQLVTVSKGTTATLSLVGQAGKAADDTDLANKGAEDTFKLVFTISKTPTTI